MVCFIQEDLVIEEVCIDYRIHPRIIGSKGRNVGRLMDEFHVEIKFPGRSAEDRSLVVVSGREEDVADCVDHLRSLEDEYVNGLGFPFNEFLHLKCFEMVDFVLSVFCI